ncbi:MAG: homocysteine S-methyltransferase family protein [Myxococcaceae bacterium]
MINCAHPTHFADRLQDAAWTRRVRGIRANASRKSHAELDASTSLDAGDPKELAEQYGRIMQLMPWLNVFGGCCGTDLRHVAEIARRLQKDAFRERHVASAAYIRHSRPKRSASP